jgi:hypothetical protein
MSPPRGGIDGGKIEEAMGGCVRINELSGGRNTAL